MLEGCRVTLMERPAGVSVRFPKAGSAMRRSASEGVHGGVRQKHRT